MISLIDTAGDRIYSVEVQPKAGSSFNLSSWNFSITNDDGVGSFGSFVNNTFFPTTSANAMNISNDYNRTILQGELDAVNITIANKIGGSTTEQMNISSELNRTYFQALSDLQNLTNIYFNLTNKNQAQNNSNFNSTDSDLQNQIKGNATYTNSTFSLQAQNNSNQAAYLNNSALPQKGDGIFLNSSNRIMQTINFIIDGQGSVITTGHKASNFSVGFNGTIKRIEIDSDVVGSMTIALTNKSDDLTGGNDIVMSGANNLVDTTLSGWNTTVKAYDTKFRIRVSSSATITNAVIKIFILRD